jgi:hypothetical protein
LRCGRGTLSALACGMRIARWLGLSSVSLASVLPATARAEAPTFGLGLFIGYNDRRAGLEWGAETFATFRTNGTSDTEPRVGVGPLLQVGLLGWRDPRLTLALHGGGELERDLLALTGELGVSYRAGAQGGFGIHAGAMSEVNLVNVAFRYQFLLREAWFGAGSRLMPTYGKPDYLESDDEDFSSIPGRPLRAAHGRVQPCAALHAADGGGCAQGFELPELGAAWERDAQLEYASIPAFIQLAHELTAQQAPASLVQRALDAARDESRHAQGCAELAARYQRHAIMPALPRYTPRPISAGRDGLVRLAVESWVDGCLAEGRAARQAEHAAELALPGAAQQLQRGIARDEHRHAELAWDTLAWALSEAPDEVRAAVRARRDCEAAPVADADAPPGLQRFGRVAAREIDRIAEQHAADSGKRLERLLAV